MLFNSIDFGLFLAIVLSAYYLIRASWQARKWMLLLSSYWFYAAWKPEFLLLLIGSTVLDFVAGRGRRPRLFYSVVRASERFDKWINLHSVVQEMDESGSEEGLLGSDAASDT